MELKVGKYRVDPVLFREGFAKGCGPQACEARCCANGVYVDPVEQRTILDYRDLVRKYMDETQPNDERKWFEATPVDDADYPSGKCVATEVFNGKCVFLNKSGLCSLQIAGREEGMGEWKLKPFFCISFPVTVEDGRLTFDDECQGDTLCCSLARVTGSALVDSCRDELEYILGPEEYRNLLALREEATRSGPAK